MKKISCCFFVIITILCISFCTGSYVYAAEEYYENGYTYTVNYADEATIVKVDTTLSGEVVTPVTLGGYPVTQIGRNSFKNCKQITGIIISQGITFVGVNAFSGCDNLERIYIPESLNDLVAQSFAYCHGLQEFIVDENNEYFSVDEYGVLFDKDKTRLVQYPLGNSRESYVVPESVVEVDNAAFSFCKNLRSVSFGNNVKKIGDSCFSYCEGLVSVNIPDSVTTIGRNTFYECASLQQVTIGSGVTRIDDSAFQWCDTLENITLPDSVTALGDNVFRNCTNLEKIELGSKLESIGKEVFNYCESLEYILVDESNGYFSADEYGVLFNKSKTELIQYPLGNERASYDIPDGVEKVCTGAFAYCADIVNVTVSDSVTIIDDAAFSNCKALQSVKLGSAVAVIGENAFQHCESIEEMKIGESVESIEHHAFISCLSLQQFEVSEGNEYYSSDEYGVLFDKEKTRLINYPLGNPRTEYVIPDSVQLIEDHAFYNCRKIVEVQIGKSVTDIGSYSFGHCFGLKYITFGSNIKNITSNAFSNCSLINTVTYYGTQEQWNEVNISANNEMLLKAEMIFVGEETDSKEIPEGNTFEYSDGVLFISGENPIESIEGEPYNEWNQYAQMTDAIVINDIPYIGENAFVGFGCLTIVVIDSDDIVLENGSFSGCDSLKYVVSFGNTEVEENAFVESFGNITLFAEKSKEVVSASPNVNATEFYQQENIIFFDDAIETSSYDLFNLIAALCIKYNDINKLHFNEFTALDFQFLEWQNENEAMWVNSLTDVTFSVKVILENAEQMMSYNELCDLVSDGAVTSFYLVAESENSYRIDDTEVSTEPQNFIFRFLKTIVTLLNKLIKIFGKSK